MKRNDDSNFEYDYKTVSNAAFMLNMIAEAKACEHNGIDSRLNKDAASEMDNDLVNLGSAKAVRCIERNRFVDSIKPMLLTSCIKELLNKSCRACYESEYYDVIKDNLVANFVEENGVNDLLRRFKTASLELNEYANIIEKYNDKIIKNVIKESSDDEEDPEGTVYYIDPDDKANFYEELKNVDNDEVIVSIRNRVSDAISQFINKNTEYKLGIKDVLDTTKDKINGIQSNDELDEEEEEDLIESYNAMARTKIHNIKNSKPTTVFEKMVYNMCENVLHTEAMHEEYMKDNRLDMDMIVESCELLYTLLEMANTTKMINVDEEYIRELVEGL